MNFSENTVICSWRHGVPNASKWCIPIIVYVPCTVLKDCISVCISNDISQVCVRTVVDPWFILVMWLQSKLEIIIHGGILYFPLCEFVSLSSPSPFTAPLPHPAPVMTGAHPMAKQRLTEPPDHQSKPLFWSLSFPESLAWNELTLQYASFWATFFRFGVCALKNNITETSCSMNKQHLTNRHRCLSDTSKSQQLRCTISLHHVWDLFTKGE